MFVQYQFVIVVVVVFGGDALVKYTAEIKTARARLLLELSGVAVNAVAR